MSTRPAVKALRRRDETIQRYTGVGDCWHMSWAADDRQYMSLCDGFGFSGQSTFVYNSRLLAVAGDPHDAHFHALHGYPQLAYGPAQRLTDTRYYGFGTLALDGRLYQFMSTYNRALAGLYPAPVNPVPDGDLLRFVGAKLIYSPDNGRTWCNQDGSTPVVWEDWKHRSRETMVFFEEDQQAFSMLSVLQMGRNYEHNRDGYVYVYAPNGNTDGSMNELVMFRVPKRRILDRAAYEYFAGLQMNGEAKWTSDIASRVPVHTFPRGWVNKTLHPYAWQPSLAYNPALDLYLMTSWGMGTALDGQWFGKPSYLGFWVATHPWAQWNQIHEETAWMPDGETSARAFQPQIAPKWIAPDGRSFWLVWTDSQVKGDPAAYQQLSSPLSSKSFDDYTRDDWALKYELMRKFTPYYSFNTQRVDILVA